VAVTVPGVLRFLGSALERARRLNLVWIIG
jgi:hypothetical protein